MRRLVEALAAVITGNAPGPNLQSLRELVDRLSARCVRAFQTDSACLHALFHSMLPHVRNENPSNLPPVPACDVLLFVTTRAERNALMFVARTLGITHEPGEANRLGAYIDLGNVGEHRVLAVPTEMGAIMPNGSASKAVLFQAATGARALLTLGMAYGIDRKTQGFGEVLVARRIFPYDSRNVVDSASGPVADYSRTKSRGAHQGLIKMLERASKRRAQPFKVSFGTILSGGARVSSAAFRDQLAQGVPAGHGTVIGGEMEGVGLLAVAQRWAVVKAISDFAESPASQTDDEQRAAACRNAASFVLTALLDDKFDHKEHTR